MKRLPMQRLVRWSMIGTLLGGGLVGGLAPGCDDDAQSVLVTGLNAAAVALINGFFQGLDPDEGTTGGVTGGVPSV